MKAEITDYLQKLPAERRETLETIREIILKTLPQAEESIQYRMPTYAADGQLIAALASQKNYLSLYLNVEALDSHRSQFDHLNCGKSCVRFKKLSDLPLETIKTILIETLALNESRV
jgi:uncharacterized protein YdhG (YjbR/CyaY superfamily)